VLSPIPPSYIDVTRLYLSKELGPKIDRRSKPLSKKQRAHQNLNPNTTIPFPNKNSKLNPSTQLTYKTVPKNPNYQSNYNPQKTQIS
jgi:hypothetical protein